MNDRAEVNGPLALTDKRLEPTHVHIWDRTPIAFSGGSMDVVLKCMICGKRGRFTLVPSDDQR